MFNLRFSQQKRCSFCDSENLNQLDHLGECLTFYCRVCQQYTIYQPPYKPFPWLSLLFLVIGLGLICLLFI